MNTKVFDLHIGVSDAVAELGKDPFNNGKPDGKFPNQFDFERAKVGKLDMFLGMICAIEIDGNDFRLPKNQAELIDKHISIYESFEKAKVLKIVRDRNDNNSLKLKVVMGIEGAYFIRTDKDLETLKKFIERGIKIIGPVWAYESNLFTNNKISKLGIKFLNLCLENNIVIDLAHSESSIFEVLINNYSGPVIDSHTCVINLNNNSRNINLEQIGRIVDRNGIIGINFVGEFLGGKTIEQVVKNIEFIVNRFGNKNISIGSDFDGMDQSDIVRGLEDVSKYENLFNVLIERFDEKTANLIMRENALNFIEKQYE